MNLIKKHYPTLIDNLSTTVSPMCAVSRMLKAKDPETVTVFIGPCMAKKAEAADKSVEGNADFVLTFGEAIELMRAKDVELEPEEEFYHIKRLRLVDDKPIFVQNSYVITEFIREEDAKDKEKFTSIYGKLRQDFGIDLYQADSKEITEIVFPAPEEESRLLELEGREPSAFIRRYTYLFDGRTIEYIEGYKRWDYFSIEIEPI